MQIYSNFRYAASTIPLSFSSTRFLDHAHKSPETFCCTWRGKGEGIEFLLVLLKWRQRGEKNGEGGGVKCRFFSSTAQARSNRMGQKDTAGGWNYDVERDTKFRGGGVIQSAPLRTQVFLIGAREKTRSTEAKKGPWYNGTRKGCVQFR